MSNIDQLVIRPATCADYVEVLDIDKKNMVHQGFDYLPQMYFSMVQTNNNYPFVAELDGNVVGFANNEIIDNGRTLYVGSSRVSEEFQRRGITLAMTQFMDQYIKDRFPDVRFRASIFIQSDVNDSWMAKIGYQLHYEWWMMRYKDEPKSLHEAIQRMEDATYSEAISLSRAINMIPDIRELITKQTQHFVCTTLGIFQPSRAPTDADLRVAAMSNDVIVSFRDDQRHLAAVSFMATQANCREAITRANIFFYGQDVEDFIDQLKLCFKKLASVMNLDYKVFGLYLHFPKSIDFKHIKEFLPSVFVPISNSDEPNTGQLAYLEM